jgi:hypothetical protein
LRIGDRKWDELSGDIGEVRIPIHVGEDFQRPRYLISATPAPLEASIVAA